MTHDHHDDDFGGLTRREALLAAGAGGFSMMGFCSACEAGEVKMTSGASTLPKNISKAAPNNAVIQEMRTAAGLFKNGSFSGVHISTDNVVSRVQEIFHKGEAAKKLGRDRSVVRISAAAIEQSDKARVLSHLSSQGFSASDLQGAQVFFTRSSLLDHTKVSGLKEMPADRAVRLESLNNTNINTLTAVSFDPKSNTLKANIVLNAARAVIQISFLNFAVSAKKAKEFQFRFIDPPALKDPSLIGRIRVISKVIKLTPPSSGSSGSSGSSDSSGSKSGDSSGSGSNDSSPFEQALCLQDCLTGFDDEAIAAVAFFCQACSYAIVVGLAAEAATVGLAIPEASAAINIACGGCAVAEVVALLTCFLGCAT